MDVLQPIRRNGLQAVKISATAYDMTDDELERLKNVNVDFSRVLKAAQKVDLAKVKAREVAPKKPASKKSAKKRTPKPD